MKVRFWKQHTMETCGIACVLMTLDAFGIDYPTVAKEQYLYRRLRSKAAPGTEGGAIACALARRGLDITLAYAGKELIDNRSGYYPPELHEALMAEQRALLDQARGMLKIEPDAMIDAAFLRAHLAQERLVILQICIPGDADGLHDHVLHGVLLYGWEGEDFLLCDPLSGRVRLPEARLLSAMRTPVGMMAISVGRK